MVIIPDRQQFETTIECLNTTASFRTIAKMFLIFGKALNTTQLGRPSQLKIGQHARVVALNLNSIRIALGAAWGFPLLADGATHRAEGYLDVRVSFELHQELHNVHLLAIPMGTQGHTGANYADQVRKVLQGIGGDEIFTKFIGITSDGAATMLGCRQGFATRIRAACPDGVTVNWCGSHQLNLAIGAFLDALDAFVSVRPALGREISFSRTHTTVAASVGACPTYSTVRWESIHDCCEFLQKHHDQLIAIQGGNKHTYAGDMWWLTLFLTAQIMSSFRHCFRRMQYKTITMEAQYCALDSLKASLQLRFESDAVSDGDADSNGPPSVDRVKVLRELSSASWRSLELLRKIDGAATQKLVDGWSASLASLIDRIDNIKIAVKGEVEVNPPEKPKAVVECDKDLIAQLLQIHKSRLRAVHGPGVCSKVWNEMQTLKVRYETDTAFKRGVDHAERMEVVEAWKEVDTQREFVNLATLIIGLAARTPGTHTVEGDFSLVKQIKGDQRCSLSNYAMEGQIQARQYFSLITLPVLWSLPVRTECRWLVAFFVSTAFAHRTTVLLGDVLILAFSTSYSKVN